MERNTNTHTHNKRKGIIAVIVIVVLIIIYCTCGYSQNKQIYQTYKHIQTQNATTVIEQIKHTRQIVDLEKKTNGIFAPFMGSSRHLFNDAIMKNQSLLEKAMNEVLQQSVTGIDEIDYTNKMNILISQQKVLNSGNAVLPNVLMTQYNDRYDKQIAAFKNGAKEYLNNKIKELNTKIQDATNLYNNSAQKVKDDKTRVSLMNQINNVKKVMNDKKKELNSKIINPMLVQFDTLIKAVNDSIAAKNADDAAKAAQQVQAQAAQSAQAAQAQAQAQAQSKNGSATPSNKGMSNPQSNGSYPAPRPGPMPRPAPGPAPAPAPGPMPGPAPKPGITFPNITNGPDCNAKRAQLGYLHDVWSSVGCYLYDTPNPW